MKNVFALLFLAMLFSTGYSQVPLIDKDGGSYRNITKKDIAKLPSRTSRYIVSANEAKYPGGQAALETYLSKNITYPNRVPYEGKMVVEFAVNKEGEVKNVVVTYSPYGDYVNSKLIQAFERMPHWIPASNKSGDLQNAYMEVPIYITTTTNHSTWDWRLKCDFYPALF